MENLITTKLEWISKLDIGVEPLNMRKTSIICTIGPKTNSVEKMNALRKAGMNIVRMNFSHGSHEFHGSIIENARKSQKEMSERPLAIALDTKGPEIRTGLMKDDIDVPIQAGHILIFTTDDKYKDQGSSEKIFIDYKNLPKVIEKGKNIYVDDGIMSFEVLEILDEQNLKVKSLNSGCLSNRKGVNLPKTNVDLPALSEKDKADLRFGVEQNVDMVFASFIRSGKDVRDIRDVLGEDGKHIKIISKIENYQGIHNFDDILKESDGIMVARGDLGIEIPCSRVFIAQKMMIAKCNLAGKPVICATQMLESMTTNPRPTRAEVSDVANAVLDGADCVMLSGETAKGNYPIEAVEMMNHVCILAEETICYPPLFNEIRALTPRPTETTETLASSAVNASLEQQASAIIVLTTSGTSARLLSKYRPRIPILSITRSPVTARQAHLSRGVFSFIYTEPRSEEGWQEDVDLRINWGIKKGIEYGIIKPGGIVIAVQGWKGGVGNTNNMRILKAEA